MAEQLPKGYRAHLMGNYAPLSPELTHGIGARLYDRAGREYYDFASGIAVSALGHGNAALVRALAKQASKLIHVSNLFVHDLAVPVARKLTAACGMRQAFFCNSGAEANECALKLARKRGVAMDKKKFRVVSLNDSFHGRVGLALAASGQAKLWQAFGPQPVGFTHVDASASALRKAISADVCAVIVEPIQGESGLRTIAPAILKLLRQLCNRHDALLIIDEIQTGMGRTGKLLAAPRTLRPDIITLAKGLGGGVPVGATLIARKALGVLGPGDHGSTYGGNALALAAVDTVLTQVSKPVFMTQVSKRAKQLDKVLREMLVADGPVCGLRGAGLLRGIELDAQQVRNTDICKRAMTTGLLLAPAGDNVVRVLPPLTVTAKELATGCQRLRNVILG